MCNSFADSLHPNFSWDNQTQKDPNNNGRIQLSLPFFSSHASILSN